MSDLRLMLYDYDSVSSGLLKHQDIFKKFNFSAAWIFPGLVNYIMGFSISSPHKMTYVTLLTIPLGFSIAIKIN